jgi:hypothetical protein
MASADADFAAEQSHERSRAERQEPGMTTRDAVGDDFGVLVIRVWREPDADQPFRARITYDGEDRATAATRPTTDPDAVLDAVRRWLDERSGDHSTS